MSLPCYAARTAESRDGRTDSRRIARRNVRRVFANLVSGHPAALGSSSNSIVSRVPLTGTESATTFGARLAEIGKLFLQFRRRGADGGNAVLAQ